MAAHHCSDASRRTAVIAASAMPRSRSYIDTTAEPASVRGVTRRRLAPIVAVLTLLVGALWLASPYAPRAASAAAQARTLGSDGDDLAPARRVSADVAKATTRTAAPPMVAGGGRRRAVIARRPGVPSIPAHDRSTPLYDLLRVYRI